jgi:diguanylate cyclase (GGDEF)-like protein/PAS domain S-box-containing protein
VKTVSKTKEQLIPKLGDLQRRIAELEKSETERKRVEETLRERDIQLKKLFSWVPGMIFQFTRRPDGSYCVPFTTEAIRDIFGCSPQDVHEDFSPIARVILPEDLEKVVDSIEYSAKHLTVWTFEYRVQIPGQPVRWLLGNSTPEELADGSITWHGFNTDITERKRREETLRESEESHRNLFENANEAIFVAQGGKIIFLNPKTTGMIGYTEEEILSRPFIEFIHPDDRDMVIDRHVRRMKGEEIPQTYDFRIFHRDGNVKWVELNVVLINWKGRTATLNFLSDLTERKKAEEALRESEERYRALIEKSNDAITLVKGDRHIFVNQNMVKMFGYDRPEEIIGQSLGMLVHPDDRKRVLDINRRRQKGEIVPKKYAVKGQRKDGELIHFEVSASKTTFQGEIVSLVYLRDITDRKQAEEALKTLSLKDDLTGLYNRRGFFALAEQGFKTAQRMKTEMVLIFGDLDNLKEINDTFGHKVGDQVLVDTSKILKETFRESDIIARIGGDEFVILAMNAPGNSCEKLITRFKQALNDHPRQKECHYTLSLSIGIAWFDPQNPCSIDALLAEADKLMYEDKQKKCR